MIAHITVDHSPTPWHTTPHSAKTYDANGDPVWANHPGNRRLIIEAVNSHVATKDFKWPDTVHVVTDAEFTRAMQIRASHDRLLEAAKGLLRFNEELCVDINVSKHYPSAEKARAAIAAAEELAP